MKKLEFETSKGRFLLIDSKDAPSSFNRYLRDIEEKLGVQLTIGYKLSEITEEKASNIVQVDEYYHGRHYYRNYVNEDGETYRSAIESLHSLLKSKGIHLFENPYTKSTDLNSSFFSMQVDFNKEKQAEQKTFYNPYIFII